MINQLNDLIENHVPVQLTQRWRNLATTAPRRLLEALLCNLSPSRQLRNHVHLIR